MGKEIVILSFIALIMVLIAGVVIFTRMPRYYEDDENIQWEERFEGKYGRDGCLNQTLYNTIERREDCIFSMAMKYKDTTYCKDIHYQPALRAKCFKILKEYYSIKKSM